MFGVNENIFSFQTDVVHKVQQAGYPQIGVNRRENQAVALSTDGCKQVFTSCVKNSRRRAEKGREMNAEKSR